MDALYLMIVGELRRRKKEKGNPLGGSSHRREPLRGRGEESLHVVAWETKRTGSWETFGEGEGGGDGGSSRRWLAEYEMTVASDKASSAPPDEHLGKKKAPAREGMMVMTQ